MKITRRTFLASTAAIAALSVSKLGMGSAKATSVSEYAKLFKTCRDAGMNIFFDIEDKITNYEDVAHNLIAGRPIDQSNSVKHRNKIVDTLRTLDLSYKIVTANALDKWDFEMPRPTGLLCGLSSFHSSNIFDDVDVIILEDFAKAMPIVQTLILQHTIWKWKTVTRPPMFIISATSPDKIYQRFHLYNPMFNFVAFPTQEV